MKKIAIFFVVLVALTNPLRAQAQNTNWVALQSDTTTISAPNQVITVTLDGSLNVPITRAGLVLHYDPNCFRVISHHPGSLLTGATVFAQAQPGQFELTYSFQGSEHGQTGTGSLIAIQLEALKRCASDLSVASKTILLGVSDTKGIISNLPGVEYRSLSIHMTSGQVPPASGAAMIAATGANPTIQKTDDSIYLILLSVTILLALGAILYFFLRHLLKEQPRKPLSLTGSFPEARTEGTFLKGTHTHLGPGYYPLCDGDQVELAGAASYRFVEHDERN